MPIAPEYKTFYASPLWKRTRLLILARAQNRCEMCGVENHTINERGSRVVLTVAHMDHGVYNLDPSNLKALCQKCHLNYDKEQHSQSRKRNRDKKRFKGQKVINWTTR